MEFNAEETVASALDASATETPAAPARRSRRATAAAGEAIAAPVSEPAAPAAAVEAPAVPAAEAPTASVAPAAESAVEAPAAPAKKRASRSRKTAEAPVTEPVENSGEAESAGSNNKAGAAAPAAEASAREEGSAETVAENGDAAPKKRNTRSRSRKAQTEAPAEDGEKQSEIKAEQPTRGGRGGSRAAASKEKAENGANGQSDAKAQADSQSEQAEGGEKSEQNERSENGSQRNGDASTRSNRTRQRERKRRGQGDDLEPEIAEDDVLLPIAGILDVLDNYAFVRTTGYLPGTGDVYVSLGQVKKYGLRKGDSVVGAIRQPREGEGGGRQKYNAIVKIDTINSKPVEENQTRPEFASLVPVFPTERLRLENGAESVTERVIDLFAPIGKGQRGLVVGPHDAGKSSALTKIARAISANHPDAHLMLVLIDERPEEVTELQRTIDGEVIASTFDRLSEDHTTIAELSIERAKRLVELGHDVVVLIDSLTALARAYNLAAPAAARVPAGHLDAAAVYPIKKLLSAARNIENGGSLTVIGAVSAQPGSQVDEALLGEIEGASNMQLRLSGDAADRRVFPAIDLLTSQTRNAQQLTSAAEAGVLDQLRRSLAGVAAEQSLESLLQQLARTSSNVEFLAVVQRQQSAS